MGKRMDYKGIKWDKKKGDVEKKYIKGMIDDLNSLEEYWKNNECEEVLYHLSKTSKMLLLSNMAYIVGEISMCKEYINILVDEMIKICEIYNQDNNISKSVKKTIKKAMDKGVEAYYAIAIDRDYELDKISSLEHVLRQLINKKYDTLKENCKENNNIDWMMMAICECDSKKFEKGLENRIKEIRKQPLDYMIIIDIWSVVLVKLAKREGMEFYHNYIEIPDFLL